MEEGSKPIGNENKKREDRHSSIDGGNVPQSVGVRCPILYGVESDRGFLCSYHLYFLPIVSLIIWTVFLLK